MEQHEKKFPLGTTLVYYNKWTNWESKEIREALEGLTFDEVAGLSVGDQIWVDVDPLHPNGKVYGCVLAAVTEIEKVDEDTVMVRYEAPNLSGGRRIYKDHGTTQLARLKNESETFVFVQDNPVATVVRERLFL